MAMATFHQGAASNSAVCTQCQQSVKAQNGHSLRVFTSGTLLYNDYSVGRFK